VVTSSRRGGCVAVCGIFEESAPVSAARRPSPVRPSIEPSVIARADVLKAIEVADLLRIPKSTVEDWARRQVIPSRKRGRRRFYLRWEVEAWLTANDHAT
jgi:excisionase family DNA binding protein